MVIVTGASRGIGKAIALALGKAGCKVLLLLNQYAQKLYSMIIKTTNLVTSIKISIIVVPILLTYGM